jgi:CubicO group peptidase (beta-lactamase class C family)
MRKKFTFVYFFFVLMLFLFSCSSQTDDIASNDDPITIGDALYFPPLNSANWETLSLEELNWNSTALEELKSFLADSNTESFLILKNGKIVVEEYFNGANSSTLNPWFSAGKTLTAFTVGLAQQDGFLSVDNRTSDYLGEGWTNMPLEKEHQITIRDQLTMSTGGDFNTMNIHCTDPECLEYLNDAGSFWFYHNAFYTLIQSVLDEAIPQGFETYFQTELENKIGLNGVWIQNGYNKFYASNAREMARFGLLNLNRGNWNGTQILNETFFDEMTNTSQSMNTSYGYLWWLNGKESYRVPGSTELFSGFLIPNAPSDLIAGLGARDQKLYVIPSMNLVIVRMGDAGNGQQLGPSSYDNDLWEKINAVIE